jgi:Sec-independent protein translocase protein TatA
MDQISPVGITNLPSCRHSQKVLSKDTKQTMTSCTRNRRHPLALAALLLCVAFFVVLLVFKSTQPIKPLFNSIRKASGSFKTAIVDESILDEAAPHLLQSDTEITASSSNEKEHDSAKETSSTEDAVAILRRLGVVGHSWRSSSSKKKKRRQERRKRRREKRYEKNLPKNVQQCLGKAKSSCHCGLVRAGDDCLNDLIKGSKCTGKPSTKSKVRDFVKSVRKSYSKFCRTP